MIGLAFHDHVGSPKLDGFDGLNGTKNLEGTEKLNRLAFGNMEWMLIDPRAPRRLLV